jgi:hypothetical protein
MKHDSYCHPLKVTLGFLAIVLLALLLGGCGLRVGVTYQHPSYGTAGVAFPLPVEGGLAK